MSSCFVEDYGDPSVLEDLMRRGVQLSDSIDSAYVVDIGNNIVVKRSTRVYHSEFSAMELVRKRTSIPCPRPISYTTNQGPLERDGYLVMEKVAGVSLASLLARLSDDDCAYIAAQLSDFARQLARLTLPGGPHSGMVERNGVYHQGYFSYEPGPCRASSVRDIAAYFIGACDRTIGNPDEYVSSVFASLEAHVDMDRPMTFNHGDLCPENILVDPETCRITAVIDWEYAGWYPYFWNYLVAYRACLRGISRNWAKIFSSYTPCYKVEFGIFQNLLFRAFNDGRQDLKGTCECCA